MFASYAHTVSKLKFGDRSMDGTRVRKDHAPENFAVLRHFAMNILKGAPPAKRGSTSINLKRMRAGFDVQYLEQVMAGAGLVKSGI